MIDLTENLRTVRRRIAAAAEAAGRRPADISLLAVSKGHAAEAVRTLAAAGQHDFGENRLQEALPKLDACSQDPPCWHFIGPIQSNKTRAIASRFAWVHSLDRLEIARRLDAQRPPEAPRLNVCLEVLLEPEAGKAGVVPQQAAALAKAVAELPRLRLRGLMCLPPPPGRPGESRPHFARLRELLGTLNAEGFALDTLSMGMSADLEEAVLEGATWVRVGTAVFGSRNIQPRR